MSDPEEPQGNQIPLKGMESDNNEYSNFDDITTMTNEIPDTVIYPDRDFHINYATPVVMGANVTPVTKCDQGTADRNPITQ